jgi:hypothetical protein
MNVSDLVPGTRESVGIDLAVLLDPPTLFCSCLRCGHAWSPAVEEGGKAAADWYVCPAGCNVRRVLVDPAVAFGRERVTAG